jgi:hypothetical protein
LGDEEAGRSDLREWQIAEELGLGDPAFGLGCIGGTGDRLLGAEATALLKATGARGALRH